MIDHTVSIGGRALVVLAALAAGMDSASAGLEFTIAPLVLEGDAVSGVGAITRIDNIAINAAGDWLVEADTDNADTNADQVLLRNGVLDLREGDALAAPVGATISSFDSINLNGSGDSAWNFFLDGTGGTSNDSGIYFNTTLVLQESEFMTAEDFSPSTPLIGIFDVKINDSGVFMSVLSIDDIAIATTVDRAVVLFTDDGQGGYDQSVIAKEEDLLPGETEGIADFGTGPHESAWNAGGEALLAVDLAGDTTVNDLIVQWDGASFTTLAREEGPSPVSGRTWATLSSTELDLGDGGDHVYSGSLNGDAATNLLIVRNGAKFKQEGDTVTTDTGTWSITSFGSGPLPLDECGNVLWYGDWDDPNLDVDTGLFLNDDLLVQEGVTTIDGIVVDLLRGIQDGYALSDDGRYVIFEAQLIDGREGAFLLDFGSSCGAEPCLADECGDANGTVDIVDLLALLANWGGAGGSCDIVPDGSVDILDLLALLAAWGPCP